MRVYKWHHTIMAGCLLLSSGLTLHARQENRQDREITADEDRPSLGMLMSAVRHELLTLPYYDVFDWMEAEVFENGRVVLTGQVVEPRTKENAEARVKDLEGVSEVVNEIEVLSVSAADQQLREQVYRAVYNWNSPLFGYATSAAPPIHIIVNNGRATLKGWVNSEVDRQAAYAAARSVPGLLEVNNELEIVN